MASRVVGMFDPDVDGETPHLSVCLLWGIAAALAAFIAVDAHWAICVAIGAVMAAGRLFAEGWLAWAPAVGAASALFAFAGGLDPWPSVWLGVGAWTAGWAVGVWHMLREHDSSGVDPEPTIWPATAGMAAYLVLAIGAGLEPWQAASAVVGVVLALALTTVAKARAHAQPLSQGGATVAGIGRP